MNTGREGGSIRYREGGRVNVRGSADACRLNIRSKKLNVGFDGLRCREGRDIVWGAVSWGGKGSTYEYDLLRCWR